MTIETPSPGAATSSGTSPTATTPRTTVAGLVCRACGRAEQAGLSYVCPACFGPLEVAYDLRAVRDTVNPNALAMRPAGVWRYQELLPVEAPVRGLPVGGTPLIDAARLGPALGVDGLLVKDDTRNPTLSFKDRAVAIATAKALDLRLDALACASTGNLAGATAAAAAAVGLPAYVFVPADLEPAKIEHALAYGATVVPIDGTYDDVNRLCLEVADELGWGTVNVNLRPYYAEGSKTLAYEIAEGLGWRLPDVVVAPIASGAMITRIARAFEELVELGWVAAHDVRFVGGQAAGCAPVARAFAEGTDTIAPVRTPDTIVRSLAIGNPADGAYALELARRSGGSIEAIDDAATADAIRAAARLEGVYTETAGGVTLGAVSAARRRGVIRAGDEVVALLTGNGLKTPDAVRHGLTDRVATARMPGLAPILPARFSAFEGWLSA
ncbi:MAG TPA: threonine synthase [Candidatus Limnocylindrales bacterium]|nr:threonine synthase [Candidatus Limnocylindrales bacterium]